MLKFPNGNEYKLVYFDTNFLSEFINNNNNFAANVIKEFIDRKDPYMFCTSFFNILELSKTNEAFEEKMKLAFDKVPIGIVKDYSELFKLEYSKNITSNDIICGAFGIKPPFNMDIHDLFRIIESLSDELKKRDLLISKEISLWNKHRLSKNKAKDFRSLLLGSMNEIVETMYSGISISTLNKYKSLECMAYIKNEFIYKTNSVIMQNSIIDMYNISILPYVDAYATERFVGNKIDHEMKSKFPYIKAKVFLVKNFKTSTNI